DRKQEISTVAVKPLIAGGEVQPLLTRDDVERVFFRSRVVEAHSGQRKERQVIAQPAGVMEQVADGDRLLIRGKPWDVFARVIVERALALLRKKQDAGRRELL